MYSSEMNTINVSLINKRHVDTLYVYCYLIWEYFIVGIDCQSSLHKIGFIMK